jgi:hypothetical protein
MHIKVEKSRQTAVSGLYEILSSVPRRKSLLTIKLQSNQQLFALTVSAHRFWLFYK